MKTNQFTLPAALLLAALTLTAAAGPTAAPAEKTATGTIITVDAQEHVLKTTAFFSGRKFMLGNDCACTLTDRSAGTVQSLRPGQKVEVAYQDVNGVRIASHVTIVPMRLEGTVKSIDSTDRLLTLHYRLHDRTFSLASDCGVTLRDDRTGSFADIRPGNHVTVTYETPGDQPVARQIAQTSLRYVGTLTAIDLEEKTLKAKSLVGARKFNVGSDCVIVLNGRLDGRLADLKPDNQLVCLYDEVNGVNVVNRIAPAASETNATPVVLNTPRMDGLGY